MFSEWLSYDPDSGVIRWVKSPTGSVAAGSVAGSVHRGDGYMRVMIGGKYYMNHHIAMILNGVDFEFVDHINGDKMDNRWCNLRPCTAAENMRNRKVNKNSKTGITGVTKHPSGKYHAYVRVKGKRINLGYFSNLWDAICARMSANNKHSFHENHGRR